MKTIKSENKLCFICMEEHEVKTVILSDTEKFKGEDVSFDATYEFCSNADEYLETESMIKGNNISMEKAYNEKLKLQKIEDNMQSLEEIDDTKDKYVFADELLLNTLRILITDNNKQSIENIIELFYKAKDWKLCRSTQIYNCEEPIKPIGNEDYE